MASSNEVYKQTTALFKFGEGVCLKDAPEFNPLGNRVCFHHNPKTVQFQSISQPLKGKQLKSQLRVLWNISTKTVLLQTESLRETLKNNQISPDYFSSRSRLQRHGLGFTL